MTWWAVLLALSSLARYEPGLWREALDVDGSASAVALQALLEEGQRRVPELLLEALTAAPLRSPRRLPRRTPSRARTLRPLRTRRR